MSYGIGAYKKTSVTTASKEKLLLLLYEAAIKNTKLAIQAIDENHIANKGKYIGKMQDIVIELNNGLDFAVGGKIAEELSALYDYIMHQSSKANINISKEPLMDCLHILNVLYEGWKDAIKSLGKA